MANDLNQCNFIGRLGKDPETKTFSSGDSVTNFSIAVGESWKDKDGQKQERTEWINVAAYKGLADICGKYLTKGSRVFISGKFRTRKWQDKDGKDRYSTEIIADQMQMLDGKPSGESGQSTSRGRPAAANTSSGGGMSQGPDDDIPFAPRSWKED